MAVRSGMEGGHYKPLSDHDVQRIHSAALDILERIGVAEPIPEMLEYARHIEEQEDEEAAEADGAGEGPPGEGGGELPDAQSMVDELERFLREQRQQDG